MVISARAEKQQRVAMQGHFNLLRPLWSEIKNCSESAGQESKSDRVFGGEIFSTGGDVKKAICIIILLLAVGLYFAKDKFYPNGSWNYRVTVSVDTPEGIKSGSAVRKISFHTEPDILNQGGTKWHLSMGEAVVVDLGHRGKLFAPMLSYLSDEDREQWTVLESFPLLEKTKIGERITLAKKQYPILVTFKDLRDPKSVELVYGMQTYDENGKLVDQMQDRFEEIFGAGVYLKEIVLEKTDAPVEHHIDALLPWLKEKKFYISDKDRRGKSLFENLEVGHFRKGVKGGR
jgi:hypothetical protein